MRIDVIAPDPARLWQQRLIERLRAGGHGVAVLLTDAPAWPLTARVALALERRVLHRGALSSPVHIEPAAAAGPGDLTIDLAGTARVDRNLMRIAFDGAFDDATVAAALASGRLVDLAVQLDGQRFAAAAPMVDNRVFIAAGVDDVLARAVTLLQRAVARFAAGERGGGPMPDPAGHRSFTAGYMTSALPRIAREALRRRRYRFAHWRVGYRLHDGPGVAETGELGTGWSLLPDDGTHFFADPFPFEHDGRRYIFVEDYPHATRKAVISVCRLDAHGVAAAPVPVLEEPHHLSYPQVFADGNDIWMLPEGSGSGRLTLYRADPFPDRWVPAATLLEGEISDATLLRRDGRYWLLATDRDGAGSTSDTLVAFHAPALAGPWTPHRANPILIDRRRARPGGAVVAVGANLVIPIQDGTDGYGAGLGLSRIERLDLDEVVLSDPRAVSPRGDFPYPQVHTLNRAGRLEVIDGIAAVRR